MSTTSLISQRRSVTPAALAVKYGAEILLDDLSVASYRALTAELLPPPLREAFALRYDKAERRAVQNLIGWARRIYPLLPSRLRYVGPYQEAEQRLAGRLQPDLATQLSNHFWIGRGDLSR